VSKLEVKTGYACVIGLGCNCDGCEKFPGAGGWTRRMMDDKDNEDNCADFSISLHPSRQKAKKIYSLVNIIWMMITLLSKVLAVVITFVRVTCSINRTVM